MCGGPLIGQSVGPFRVLDKLGSGGMGEVYLAEDTRLGRKVALKSPSASWLSDSNARERLQREARAAARLNHPRIAAVYDVLELAGRPYIVMEYVEGETLAASLRRGPMLLERAVALGLDLTDALAAAHAAGVIHRDLKPGNIILTGTGDLKVLDFGLAKTLQREDDANLTHPGQVLGTPGYVAPEQLLGKPADVRCDVYSAGAILYEMLTGRAPFEQGDSMGRALAALMERVPPPHQVNVTVPRDLSDVVQRAMARDPADRYQTADALRDALQRAAASLGNTPTRLFGASAETHPRNRMRWQVAVAVAALLAVAGVPFARWWTNREAGKPAATEPVRPVPVIAVLPFDNLSGDPSLHYVGAGVADTTSTSLASLPTVSVIARSQIHDAMQRDSDIGRICRALGASYVVSGSVQKVGQRLRINVNLLNPEGRIVAGSGSTYEDDFANLFTLQRRIAEGLSSRVVGTLSDTQRAGLSRSPTRDVEALSRYWQGRALLDTPVRKGAIDAAVEHFNEAIRRDPQFALAHAGLGDAFWLRYTETKNPEDATAALAAIERAKSVDPEDPLVHLSLAQSYQRTGRIDEAARELEAVITLRPTNDDAHRLLGAIYEQKGKMPEALAEYKRAIAIRPEYPRNHAGLGAFYFRTGQLADAAIEFQRVTELQPDDPTGYLNLGAAFHAAGDTRRAVANYRHANEISPTDVALSNLGALYHGEGRFDDAIAAYGAAIKLTPGVPNFHRNLGDAYRAKGDEPAARDAYARAIDMAQRMLSVNAGDAEALSIMAICEAKLGRFDRARSLAADAMRRAPESGAVLY
ncbi:MAG: tetratricopeptide repeat protein, partial [Acidobacteria bacterium]|nr:tetratricopeptide repeat protein [Acidobacteriota bacterium]